jgi:transposase
MRPVSRRSFTDDFKSQAVTLSESLGRTAAARKLDISVKTLANWVTLTQKMPSATTSPSSKRQRVSDVHAELAQLRAENATLKMERDILKKATAFFAKESR